LLASVAVTSMLMSGPPWLFDTVPEIAPESGTTGGVAVGVFVLEQLDTASTTMTPQRHSPSGRRLD
jgi:hypothetical protein